MSQEKKKEIMEYRARLHAPFLRAAKNMLRECDFLCDHLEEKMK